MEARTIIASRRGLWRPVLVAAVLAPTSWWAARMRFDEVGLAFRAVIFGWFGVVFFSLWLIVSLVSWARPTRLELTPEALIIKAPLRRRRVLAWRDIDRFLVWTRPRGGKMVAWRYAAGREPASRRVDLSGEPEGGLGGAFGMSVEALAALLEDCRSRAASVR